MSRETASKKVSVVIPVFRSEESLEPLVARLLVTLTGLGQDYEIILVDDASPDNSWSVLKDIKDRNPEGVKIVRLMSNSGQHNAILCGFSLVTGDVVVTMDDDLQNPPEEVPKLLEAIDSGFDLAIGAYEREKQGGFRGWGGRMVDWVQRRIFGLPPRFQLTSFRALRRSLVDSVRDMGGAYPYVTSMLLSNTSRCTNVAVDHLPREFGTSNYSLKKSFRLTLNLIFSFSSYPIYFIAGLCAFAVLFSLGYGSFVVYNTLVHGTAVPGWASTIIFVSLFNGLILSGLFVFGFYLSRMYQQITRSRTRYHIGEIFD
jgi:glycosyltransferase involved in cell wall biosynthesis